MARVLSNETVAARVKHLVVEKGVATWVYKIPPHILRDVSVDAVPDYLAAETIYHVSVYLATAKHEDKTTSRSVIAHLEVPTTWWDHFKHRWFPGWALKRWPVKWQHHDITTVETVTTITTHICPHIEAPKQDRQHFEFLEMGPVPPAPIRGRR